jgi:hypothetical protein
MDRPRAQRVPGFAVILGTNEVASAVAVYLHRAGYCVALSHDPNPPVMRRKMAFHDALFTDVARLENVLGERVEDAMQLFKALCRPARVLVTWLGLLDLLPVREIDVLVDARMQKRAITPDLRGLTRLSIGLGPGFSPRANCDIAIETRPGKNGLILHEGWTDPADGVAHKLGAIGAERFVYTAFEGRWHTAVDIGTRVYKGFIIGHLSGTPVMAPRDGILRGVVRDGSEVPSGVKLLEIDGRGRLSQWTGMDDRGRAIAGATLTAIQRHSATNTLHRNPV